MRWAGTSALRLAALLASAFSAAGCLVELPAVCGDGHVDLASEACDPAAVGPKNGESCDPFTCLPVSELGCGNGKLEPGEECDSPDFGNKKNCPSGKGFLSCTSDCKLDESTCDPCGNGKLEVEAGEECDPRAGLLTQPQSCSELTSYPTKPYTSGQVTQCTDNCLWYRGPCGYCGDDEADDPQLVDVRYPDAKSKWELCDGEDVRLTDLHAYCDANCPLPGRLCTPRCSATCEAFEPISDEELQCCLPAGTDCPSQGALAPCCAGFAPDVSDPFDPLTTCELRFKTDDMGHSVQKNVCR
jgi:hypothetical protein